MKVTHHGCITSELKPSVMRHGCITCMFILLKMLMCHALLLEVEELIVMCLRCITWVVFFRKLNLLFAYMYYMNNYFIYILVTFICILINKMRTVWVRQANRPRQPKAKRMAEACF